MNLRQCTFSQDMEGDYLLTSSLDTGQLSLLSGTDTPAKSSEKEPQMDGSPDCECGKGTLDCLIHPSTPETWIASMRGSLAKILALPENRQALAQKRAVVFTVKSSASLAWFDRDTCSWKTSQQSLLTDSEPSSLTWPRSGMTLNGYAYELPTVGRRTIETDGGCWPTPATRDYKGARSPEAMGKTGRNPETNSLPDAVGAHSGMRMNPKWVEWLMGFPIGFTASRDWVTHKFHCKRQQPGNSSEAHESREG